MKPFETLPRNATSSVIRTPVRLQSFEMLPQGKKPAANVSSAVPGIKSYEIPTAVRSAAGALGEHANYAAQSSAGCGCGGGCGPCGGAKASLMGGASGSGGAGAVVRAPAALRTFEMLPQGMNAGAGLSSGAGGMRGYGVPPNAKVAAQGLTGPQKVPKAYEIMPRAGLATRGLKSAGCGCGGNCGPCSGEVAASGGHPQFSIPSVLRKYDVHTATSFDPPILRGGSSACDMISQQIDSLIAEYFRNRTRCQAYRDIWTQCWRGTGPLPCYSYQLEDNALEAQDQELVAQWAAAPDGPEGNDERTRVNRLRNAISAYRMNVLHPAQIRCDMTVAFDIDARNAECLRQERYVRECVLDLSDRGQDLIKALENLIAWAQRIGCNIDPGLYNYIDWTVGWVTGSVGNATGFSLDALAEDFRVGRR